MDREEIIQELERQRKLLLNYEELEVDMEDGHFYKRFDFYSVDPESEYCIVLKTDTTAVRLEQLEQELVGEQR